MPAYSTDLRQKIVEAYEAGDTSIRKVAKRFAVSPGVVQRLLKRRKNSEDISPLPTGRAVGSGILHEHRDLMMTLVEENPDWTLRDYCDALAADHDIDVGTTTVWRFFQVEDITLKKRRSGLSKRPVSRDSSPA